MKRLTKKKLNEERSSRKLGWMMRRLQATTSLHLYCLGLELRHRRRLAKRQVKKHMRLPKMTRYSKRYSIPIMKMYRSSVRRALRLKARLNAHEHNALLTLRNVVRSLFRLTTTAHTQGVGQQVKVRGLTYKTSRGGRSYASLSGHHKVTRSLFVTSRRLNHESWHTSPTTVRFLKSLRQDKMRMHNLVRRCSEYQTLTKKLTPTSDSPLSLHY